MASEMMERVAQVLRISLHLASAREREAAERAARAVLQAIREPTDAMVSEAIAERHSAGVPEAWSLATANIWRTMIDAALANEPR